MMSKQRFEQICKLTLMDTFISIIAIFAVPFFVMWLWNNNISTIFNTDLLPILSYWRTFLYMWVIWVFMGNVKIEPTGGDKNPTIPKVIIYCLAYALITIVEFIVIGKIYNGLFIPDFENLTSLPYLSGGQLFIIWLFIKLVFRRIKISFVTSEDLKEVEEEKKRQ